MWPGPWQKGPDLEKHSAGLEAAVPLLSTVTFSVGTCGYPIPASRPNRQASFAQGESRAWDGAGTHVLRPFKFNVLSVL